MIRGSALRDSAMPHLAPAHSSTARLVVWAVVGPTAAARTNKASTAREARQARPIIVETADGSLGCLSSAAAQTRTQSNSGPNTRDNRKD